MNRLEVIWNVLQGITDEHVDEVNAELNLENTPFYPTEEELEENPRMYPMRKAKWTYIFKGLMCILFGKREDVGNNWHLGYTGKKGSEFNGEYTEEWWEEIHVSIEKWAWSINRMVV